MGDKESPRRVYLLSIPRTASNLLVKMLNLAEQTRVASNPHLAGYFYLRPFVDRNLLEMWHVSCSQIPKDKKIQIQTSLQNATDNFNTFVETAKRENKTVFVKEHVPFITKAQVFEEMWFGTPADTIPAPWTVHINPATDVHSPTNPTYLPDNFLTTFTPVFLIRHPALAFPSSLRADFGTDTNFEQLQVSESEMALTDMLASYQGMRRLYDFYLAQHDIDPSNHARPTIIEASDLINHPKPVMFHFCEVTGIDKTKLRFSWDAATQEELAKQGSDIDRRFLSTISASTGVLRGKAGVQVDVDAEVVKWREEFGLIMGGNLERWVRRSVPDYEYLWNQRWCPPFPPDSIE